MIDLTQYENELLWFKTSPQILYTKELGYHVIIGEELVKIKYRTKYGNVPIHVGISENDREFGTSINGDYRPYKGFYIPDQFWIRKRKTRIYLEILQTNEKYKFDMNWNPVNCTIPDELEEQLVYLKLKNIIN